jgi:hypothetical protein
MVGTGSNVTMAFTALFVSSTHCSQSSCYGGGAEMISGLIMLLTVIVLAAVMYGTWVLGEVNKQ